VSLLRPLDLKKWLHGGSHLGQILSPRKSWGEKVEIDRHGKPCVGRIQKARLDMQMGGISIELTLFP